MKVSVTADCTFASASRKHVHEKTTTLEPHFYIEKLGFAGVYLSASRKHVHEKKKKKKKKKKTNPTFILKNWGLQAKGIPLFISVLFKNKDCRYSLGRGGSNVYHNLYFEQNY